MKRQSITNGGWFDIDRATKYTEATRWNGNNHISLATGSQWNHESLYCTANHAWILHEWSQWQGSGESYTKIDKTSASEWLTRMGCEVPLDLIAEQARGEV